MGKETLDDLMNHEARRARGSTISVVIPAYNSEAFLEEAIASVYAQSVTPTEVIVVNDGSTDGTERLLRRLASHLPSTFRWVSKSNSGPGSARNVGIRLTAGEVVAFLDADDLWYVDKLAQQMEQLWSDKTLSLSFTALGRTRWVDSRESAETSARSEPKTPRGEAPSRSAEILYLHREWDPTWQAVLRSLMGSSPIGSPSTVAVRREALELAAPFNDAVRLEDWLMWLNLAAAGVNFGHVPEPLVEYRWHDGNRSADRLQLLNGICDAFEEFRSTTSLSKRLLKEVGLRPSCAHWHLITAIEASRAGQEQFARRHLWRAAIVHPASVRLGWARFLGIGLRPRDADG